MQQEILHDLEVKMNQTLISLRSNLAGLKTGRASSALLNPVKVKIYEEHYLPVNQVSSISIPDTRTLLIQIWNKALVQNVKKAILNSDIGLTPNCEGQIIKLNIPQSSEERRKELVKNANDYSEQSKISIRSIRKNGIDIFKKQERNKIISKDELRHYIQTVQKATDLFIIKIQAIFSKKSQDIMNI